MALGLTFFTAKSNLLPYMYQNLKKQLYSSLPMAHVLIGLWSFIKLSCMVQKLLHFSQTDSQVGDMCQSS